MTVGHSPENEQIGFARPVSDHQLPPSASGGHRVPPIQVVQSTQIARPPESVWEIIADPTRDPQWCHRVKSVRPVGPGRWSVVHRPVPLRRAMPLSLEHLAVTPPGLLTLREEDDVSVFIVEYRLASVPGGTELTQISRVDWKQLPRGLHWLFARGIRRDMRLQLKDLRRLLEKDPGVS